MRAGPRPSTASRRRIPLAAGLLWLMTVLPGPLMAAPERVPGGIRFTYSSPGAGVVLWAGEFNQWSATSHPLERGPDGLWSLVLPLPPGEHQYKFVVDGQWFADPENPVTAGEFGNSVVRIGPDGNLVAQAPTSNTPHSPKILASGRIIGLYVTAFNSENGRYELTRPTFDVDLGFDVRVSDVLKARVLMNINPESENVQDFRSRLNFKRGSLLLSQPALDVLAFDSENIGSWDDPLQLVGGIGIFDHPYGFQRQGVRVGARKFGFDAEMLYTDNFDDRLLTNSDQFLGYRIDNFPEFVIGTQNQPRFTFETDPVGRVLTLLQTRRMPDGFALVSNQATKVMTLDFGDNGRLFGFGDNNENMFAARIRRELPGGWQAGLLGRSDRGFNLGRLVLAEPTGDSTVRLLHCLTSQQWFGFGGEVSWEPNPQLKLFGAALGGARRLGLVNGSTYSDYRVTTIHAGGVRVSRSPDSIVVRGADGEHLTMDESGRVRIGGSWIFARGDITLRGDVEHETHRYPAWSQAPIIPAGLPPDDHPRFETVEFQRAVYLNADDELKNSAATWRIGWDRNWRYYLNREVRTSLDLEWTSFTYDSRTAWEHQLWFPTGNFWLESGQHEVSTDRLTVLGETKAVRVRTRLDVPLIQSHDMRFTYRGLLSGVSLGKRPRYAESVFQFGFDVHPTLRLQSDTRWVKYDVPILGLGSGYVSTFAEAVLQFSPSIQVSFGIGVDPNVLDRNLNEYAYIGRDLFLIERNANGFIAETDYLSLAPQISSAERALQSEKRFQVQAIVNF